MSREYHGIQTCDVKHFLGPDTQRQLERIRGQLLAHDELDAAGMVDAMIGTARMAYRLLTMRQEALYDVLSAFDDGHEYFWDECMAPRIAKWRDGE